MPEAVREMAVSVPPHGRSLSLDQTAARVRVSRRTVYNRIREGRYVTIRTMGGSQRVLVESLLEDRDRDPKPKKKRTAKPKPLESRRPEEDAPLPFPGSTP